MRAKLKKIRRAMLKKEPIPLAGAVKEPAGSDAAEHSKKAANHNVRGVLKLKHACEYLGGLSVPTMHRLIKRGLLRPNRSTRHLLFSIAELERFLRDGMSGATTGASR